MQDANYLYPFWRETVKNNVAIYREAEQAFCQFFAHTAHVWPSSKHIYFPVKKVNKTACPLFAVIRDIIPDFSKVSYSSRA